MPEPVAPMTCRWWRASGTRSATGRCVAGVGVARAAWPPGRAWRCRWGGDGAGAGAVEAGDVASSVGRCAIAASSGTDSRSPRPRRRRVDARGRGGGGGGGCSGCARCRRRTLAASAWARPRATSRAATDLALVGVGGQQGRHGVADDGLELAAALLADDRAVLRGVLQRGLRIAVQRPGLRPRRRASAERLRPVPGVIASSRRPTSRVRAGRCGRAGRRGGPAATRRPVTGRARTCTQAYSSRPEPDRRAEQRADRVGVEVAADRQRLGAGQPQLAADHQPPLPVARRAAAAARLGRCGCARRARPPRRRVRPGRAGSTPGTHSRIATPASENTYSHATCGWPVNARRQPGPQQADQVGPQRGPARGIDRGRGEHGDLTGVGQQQRSWQRRAHHRRPTTIPVMSAARTGAAIGPQSRARSRSRASSASSAPPGSRR